MKYFIELSKIIIFALLLIFLDTAPVKISLNYGYENLAVLFVFIWVPFITFFMFLNKKIRNYFFSEKECDD